MKPQTAVQRAMQAHFGAAAQTKPNSGFAIGFEAGWNAAITEAMALLRQCKQDAPAEAATSDRRRENITKTSIPCVEAKCQ